MVGLVAASQSGNIIRLGDAHPVTIAAFRLGLASLFFIALSGAKLRQLWTLSQREVGLLFAAGVALAFHFFAWIGAVQLTTVANAAIFFAINPVITSTAAHFVFQERLTGRLLASIGLGLFGVAVLGWQDLNLSPQHLPGDGAALVCSLLFTLYFLLGKTLRRKLDTGVYVAALYGVAALTSILAMLVLNEPFTGYTDRTYLCFVLMAMVPTIIGHTSLNHALRHIDAGKVSALTLSEPALAAGVAYFAWDEALSSQAAVGYAVICASVLVLVSERFVRRAVTDPASVRR
jgi:drug/metabolite transporter (DMT)-like permease